MQCPKCGNENLEPASVCQVCAAPLGAPTEAAADAAGAADVEKPAWAESASEQPLTAQLYAAAIGPVHTGYYLNQFARFDHRGKAVLTWNWPAFVATLGWMAFRRLWAEAITYLGLAVVACVLLLGLLPMWLGSSESVLGGAAAALLLLLCVPPALLANGLYYRAINRHVTRALAESPDIATTQESLRHYASSRPRALVVGAVVGVSWLLTAALAAWQWWPEVVPANDVTARAALPTVPAPLRLGAAASAAAPASTPASAPASAPTAWPASAPGAAPASAPMAPTSSLVPASAASAPASTQANASPAPAPRVSAPAATPASAPVATKAPAAASKPVTAPRSADTPRKPAAGNTAATPPKARHWVAVGIFAQPENAQRLRAQVTELGLPVRADQVQSLRGELTRVRVGPFENRAQAKAAQAKLQQAGIQGVVLKP